MKVCMTVSHDNFKHIKGAEIEKMQLTDSVPPSIRFSSKYQVMWAGGRDPELLQTISDGSPTTS